MINELYNIINNKDYKISLYNNKVHILNYKSTLDITDTLVLIKLDSNILKIYGKNMKLLKMDKFELLIDGEVNKIEII